MAKREEKKDEGEYAHYPIVIVASNDVTKYAWPILARLEQNNGIRIRVTESYLPGVARIKELLKKYADEVSRQETTCLDKNKKKLQIKEIVFELIPACRR
jgi:hypothetical protein